MYVIQLVFSSVLVRVHRINQFHAYCCNTMRSCSTVLCFESQGIEGQATT